MTPYEPKVIGTIRGLGRRGRPVNNLIKRIKRVSVYRPSQARCRMIRDRRFGITNWTNYCTRSLLYAPANPTGHSSPSPHAEIRSAVNQSSRSMSSLRRRGPIGGVLLR
jgi:hypothetical protein